MLTFRSNMDSQGAMGIHSPVARISQLQPCPALTLKHIAGFSDVAPDAWYASAVAWAAEKGIVLGSNGKFDPDAAITREQLAAILYRYSGSPQTAGTLAAFTDAPDVSNWAVTPLSWTVEAKYLSGMTQTTIAPQSTATRAQYAMLLYRMAD